MTTLDTQFEVVTIELPELKATALLIIGIMILGQAAQQPQHMQREQFIQPCRGLKFSGQCRQIQILPIAMLGVRCLLWQALQQSPFQLQGAGKALTGSPRHTMAHIQRYLRVVDQQPHLLQLLECAGNLFRLQTGQLHQLVGIHPFINIGAVEKAQNSLDSSNRRCGNSAFSKRFSASSSLTSSRAGKICVWFSSRLR